MNTASPELAVGPTSQTQVRVLILAVSPSEAETMVDALREAGLDPEWQRVESESDFAGRLACEPDLILSDISLPQFNGLRALQHVRSSGLDVPFIIVASNIGEDITVEAMRSGADDYVFKDRMARLGQAALQAREKRRLGVEKERAESAQRMSEERFRQMAENIRDVFFLTDADSDRFLYISPAYEEIWGRSCDSLYANPVSWTEAIHPADRALTCEKYQNGKSAGRSEFEYRIVRPDGAIRWMEARCFPVLDDAGKVVRVAGVAQDISERKLVANKLRESDRRLSDMLGNVELISVILDREGKITYCNDYFLKLTDRRREEVLGWSFFELFLPPDIYREMREVHSALLDNLPTAWHYENEIITRSGERRLIHWNNSLLRSEAGDVIGTASIGEDVTERRRADIRIKHLNRVYAMLSQINALIVRVKDRKNLFTEACRIAVEAGAYRMAWIGVVDPDTLDAKVVAWHGGEQGYVDQILLTAREGAPGSERPACRALRNSQPVICNDIANDLSIGPLRNELLRRGHKSVGCFPLTVTGRPEAVIALFAGESDVFDDEETRLLLELAGDITFAVNHIGKKERLNYLAYYDVLTGLANPSLLLERVAQYMRSDVGGEDRLALFLIDLERFKNINDTLGRPAGDALLKQVAEWLTRNVGDANLLARVGGDRFAVVLPDIKQDCDVAQLLERMMKTLLEHPFRLNDAVFRIAAKVGVALFPRDGVNADTLFKNAEAALKKAKASGDRYLFYAHEMTETVAVRLTLENQLRQAFDKEEFVLHYQPKVNLATGRLTGAEALIRWNNPRTGLVPPAQFIPVLEEIGLINEVGRWALRKAMEDYLRWCGAGLAAVRIAVNVSSLQLRNPRFVGEIKQAIGMGPHAAAGLELEITESLIMEDAKQSVATLHAIRALGVSIAIDDFGTGFSSLNYLSKLPADTLKIDRSFVTDLTVTPEGLALVSTIINLAHSLKLKVVAEGVETKEQLRLLRLLNCDEMQGFLFGKAVPSDIFEATYLTRGANKNLVTTGQRSPRPADPRAVGR